MTSLDARRPREPHTAWHRRPAPGVPPGHGLPPPRANEEVTIISTQTQSTEAATAGFAALGVAPHIVAALDGLGITSPFPIQSSTIPVALSGADIIGQAKTGTGKTLAFGVPVLQRIEESEDAAVTAAAAPAAPRRPRGPAAPRAAAAARPAPTPATSCRRPAAPRRR